MQSGRRNSPRHLAGASSRRPTPPGTRRPAPARHLAAPSRPAPAAAEIVLEDAPTGEVAPLARVRRSRLAFALAASVAALPVLVVDNLPATASPDEQHEAVEIAAERPAASSTSERSARSTLREPTSTTVVVEEAPAVEETTTTEAEPTTTETEPPAPETTAAPEISTLRAPAAAEPSTTVAPAPTTTTTEAPAPAPAPAPPAEPDPGLAYGDPADPATWDRLARCESGGNWATNTGNGYYGGLQFSLATWQGVGGSGYPHEATRDEQIRRGQILQERYGWGQWPHCSAKLGYR